jgi:hypothetical protein
MKTNNIRLGKQRVQLNILSPNFIERGILKKIIAENVYAEAGEQPSQDTADLSCADNSDCLSMDSKPRRPSMEKLPSRTRL